jgi:hypothetical protein
MAKAKFSLVSSVSVLGLFTAFFVNDKFTGKDSVIQPQMFFLLQATTCSSVQITNTNFT